MDTIKIEKNNVKMIAHRGLSGILQENTIPAFNLAAQHSYFGIETDVHVTKDGKYIICHDDNLQRVAGIDMVIEQSNYEDLRKVRLFNKDGSMSEDLYLPNLEEYITICRNNNKVSVLELKNLMTEENVVEIVNIVKKLNHYENTIFISFSHENLVYCKKNFDDINCQFLMDINTKERAEFAFNFAKTYNIDLDLFYGPLTKDFIGLCKENGIKVNVWTVDDSNKAKELISNNVDFITSNILE